MIRWSIYTSYFLSELIALDLCGEVPLYSSHPGGVVPTVCTGCASRTVSLGRASTIWSICSSLQDPFGWSKGNYIRWPMELILNCPMNTKCGVPSLTEYPCMWLKFLTCSFLLYKCHGQGMLMCQECYIRFYKVTFRPSSLHLCQYLSLFGTKRAATAHSW